MQQNIIQYSYQILHYVLITINSSQIIFREHEKKKALY